MAVAFTSFSIRCVPPAIVPVAYGNTLVRSLIKGRGDYLTGVLGQGVGRVSGTVKEVSLPANTPVYRRVRLHRQSDGMLIQEQWSNSATGDYRFDFVDELQKYYVVSFDHNHNFRAVVGDNLTPDIIT